MLWLAGLMGVIGVSAASLFVSQCGEDPEDDALDDDIDRSDQGDLIRIGGGVGGGEYTLGPDASGNAFSLSPDLAEETDQLRKEDYVFRAPLDDDLHADLARPVLPDTDMHAPFAVLGQDKDIFIDRLPSDKEALFPDYENDSDPLQLLVDPLSGALGKQLLHDTVHGPQSNSITDNSEATVTESLHDDLALPQESAIEEVSTSPFMLGEWVRDGQTSEILDYEADHDSLMLIWDDTITEAIEPDVIVVGNPFDTGIRDVLVNGRSVAEVYGDPALDTSDITLIPLSSALRIGLEPI